MTGASAVPIARVATWCAILLLGGWAAGYLALPFSNDQGILIWMGEMVRSGAMPYRDAWDVKGPMAYLLYAIPGAVFGRNQWGLRLFDLLVVGLGAWCLTRIVARLGAARASCGIAALLYVLWYASLDHHATAQADGWVAVMLAGVAALLVGRGTAVGAGAASLAAGALLGAATLVKPTFAAFLAMPMLQGLVLWRVAGARRVVGGWLAVAAGMALVVGACLTWFAARGALGELVDVQFGWIPSSYSDVTTAWPSRVYSLLHHLTARHFALAIPFVVAGAILAWRRDRADAALLLGWVGAALLNVTVQGNFWEYHWHPLYPPMAVLAAVAIGGLLAEVRTMPPRLEALRVLGGASVAVLLAGAALEPAMDVYRSVARPATWNALLGPYGRDGEFDQATRLVRARTRPGEAVLVWGGLAGVNWLADRPTITRFAHMKPLVSLPADARRERYRRELLDAMHRRPPRYLLALSEEFCARGPSEDDRFLAGEVPRVMNCLQDLPALRVIVRREYARETRIGMLDVWRRRDAE